MGGMAWRRADGIVRPLLAQRRAVLRAWLAAGGHPYVDDPSNADLRFERPRVRALVPSLEAFDPRAIEHLARLADEARGATAAVRARARVWRARAESPAGLRVSVLRAASATVRREVLRCWLEERAVSSVGRLRELEAVVRAGRGEAVLAPDLCARVDGGVLGWGTPSGPSRSARGTTSRSDRSSD
jgi:tRNA(Ile)-lysidine synthase